MSDLLLMLIEHLEAQNIVKGDGVDSFRDFTPDKPDDVIVLHEYQGDPVPMHGGFVNRSIQIKTRASKATVAKQKAYEIFDELSEPDYHKTLHNGTQCLIYVRQPPFKLQVDDSGRVTYVFNIGITVEGGMR